MTIQTIPDITPGSATVALSATSISAVWVLVTFSAGGRVGDVNTGSGRGLAVPANMPTLIPRCAFTQGGYDLAATYVYATSGTVSVTFGS